MNCYHNEVVYAVTLIPKCDWPLQQIRIQLCIARGGGKLMMFHKLERTSCDIKSNFGEEQTYGKTERKGGVGGWRKRKVKRIGRFLQ